MNITRVLTWLTVACLSLTGLSWGRAGNDNSLTMNHSSATARIVGGQDAEKGIYAFMAALNTPGQPLSSGQFCGACLIHPDWVLTAAHCLYDKPRRLLSANEIEVVLNVYDLRTDAGEPFPVRRMITHPRYQYSQDDYDFALLELERRAAAYAPVLLYQGNAELAGEMATVLGWGQTGDGSYSDILQAVQLEIVANAACNQVFNQQGGYGFNPITDNMLCAGSPGKDSCYGDSGGPLLLRNHRQGWRLAGLVSWGPNRCAQPELYGVYSRIAAAVAFIQEYVPLSGYPEITVTPAAYSFGQVETHHHYAQRFTIANSGTAPLLIGTIRLDSANSDFTILSDSCSMNTLETLAGCSLEVQLNASIPGVMVTSLVIPSNDPDREELRITLSAEVKAANRPPQAAAGDDRVVASAARVLLDGSSSSDPDGDLVFWQWQQVSGAAVTLTAETNSAASFIAPETTAHDLLLEFELLVADQHGASAADRIVITVQPRLEAQPQAPDVPAISDDQGGGGSGGCFLLDARWRAP